MTIYEEFQKAVFPNENTVVAITGLSKNAGKTSLLNWLIRSFPDYQYGITTTGRDGEEKDLVFGTDKPKVKVSKGTIFSTFASEITKQSSFFTILERTEFNAAGRDIWIVQALLDADVEIVGPASVIEQQKIIERLQIHGARTIIVDGSLDRKAIILNTKLNAMIITAGADFGDPDMIVKELQRLMILRSIPIFPDALIQTENIAVFTETWKSTPLRSLLGNEEEFLQLCREAHPEKIYIPGAITSGSWQKLGPFLIDYHGTLIVKHPFNLQLNVVNLEMLTAQTRIRSLYPFHFNAIAVSSGSVTGNHLDSRKLIQLVRDFIPGLPVVDTMGIVEGC